MGPGLVSVFVPPASSPACSFEVDIWDNNNLTLLAEYKALAGDAVGMFSMQPEELPGTNNWLPDGTPVVIAAKYATKRPKHPANPRAAAVGAGGAPCYRCQAVCDSSACACAAADFFSQCESALPVLYPPPCARNPRPCRDLWYPDVNATDPFGDMEGRIRAVMAANPPPFFMVVYGQVRRYPLVARG